MSEKNNTHLVAMMNNQVIGTILLVSKKKTIVQFKQVAVDTEYQGLGIGKQLLEFAEKIACLMGFDIAFLLGRSQAWNFYELNGYKGLGDSYKEGILCFKKYYKKIISKENVLI